MRRQNWLLILGVVILAVAPLLIVKPTGDDGVFGGADDQAASAITEAHPGYQPWFTPLWTPPSGEIASLLFALQAAFGAGAIAYCLGYYRGRKQSSRQNDASR